jgi:lysophospholipase L1-like esterase
VSAPSPDTRSASDRSHCRLGVLAFGDSITNGGGELQWGVALQSWALWVARGLGLPYTGYAVDGARVGDVNSQQLPSFRLRSAHPDARYDVGCLYIGVNDVRAPDWEAAAFAAGFEQALRFISGRCERTLALTAPLALGRPPAGAKVAELNALVREVSAAVGAQVIELSDFGGRTLVMADRVHPTALGQIAIAERVLGALALDGMRVVVAPSQLISYRTTPVGRLRGEATYAYRAARELARGWIRSRR